MRAEDEGVLILRGVVVLSMRHFFTASIVVLATTTFSACRSPDVDVAQKNIKTVMQDLSSLCDQTFEGQATSDDPQDEGWRAVTLVLGPIGCPSETQIVMPLAVGENKSRTWFLTQQSESIEFRHQHLLDNGDIDPVSDYGGFSENFADSALGWKVEFPADVKTIEIFNENDLQVSTTNVWSFEYIRGEALHYELNRENRHFRVEFDLTRPE